MTAARLIDALSRPDAYPFPVDRVEVRQTHISILFFAGDRVYKVKKPLDLGFLDFTTLDRRRYFCEEEVRLNRRLAPRVYLGVVPIVRGPRDGLVVSGSGGDGPREAVEYAVEMRRLPEDRMLDRLLDAGAIGGDEIDRIVDVLVRFHHDAATGPGVDEHGEPDAIARAVLDNLAQARGAAGPPPRGQGTASATLLAHLEHATRSFLNGHRDLMAARVAGGRIRDGHGDLHAANICLTEGGIVIYDCIEFDPRLRCGDVARDLAFLLMDLDMRGFRELGRRVEDRYTQASGDEGLRALLPFYKAHLAAVRGKVASIAAGETDLAEGSRADARREAMRYFHLAAGYGLPPALLLMCGLPATGKSRVAAAIARPLDAAVIRSDVVRKHLAGVPVNQHAAGAEAEALYSIRMSSRTYEAMLEEAARTLDGRRSVVVDATLPTAGSRQRFIALAEARRAPWAVVYLTCSDEVIAARMSKRRDAPDEVSDADWSVYQSFKKSFEPPSEIPASHLVHGDGADDPVPVVADVIDALLNLTRFGPGGP